MYNAILNKLLNHVPDTYDKRQGSVIYNALAPVAMESADTYLLMDIWYSQTSLLTAVGDWLNHKGLDYSIIRLPATKALRIAEFRNSDNELMEVPIGSRFAIPSERETINFEAVERLEDKTYILQAETAGTVGNEYLGDVLPITIINNLVSANIIGTQIPARDEETDDEYRMRIIERIRHKSFAGNKASYKEMVAEIEGTGAVKVFPVWDGGGTVKLSIIDGNYDTLSDEFIAIIKQTIDPIEHTGEGVGLAPIGHNVTVVTPIKKIINIEATVTLSGLTVGQIQAQAEENIAEYLKSVRQTWANSEIINIYTLMIANAILKINGVINVTNIKINGFNEDLKLSQTAELQELPYVETVFLIQNF